MTPGVIRDPSGTDRLATAVVCLGVKLAVMDKTVCVSSRCIQSALNVSGSADEQGRVVLYGGSRQRRNRWWLRFLGNKLAMAPSGFRIKRCCTSRDPGLFGGRQELDLDGKLHAFSVYRNRLRGKVQKDRKDRKDRG